MPKPLQGITVLDFTRYQQGPYATSLLADFGARVIKVEDPNGGDFGRRMWKEPDGFSAFWESLNRGKESVTLDMRDPEARAVALRLGAKSDVVVENFRPGTMERWGLGYADFKAVNAGVIYAQATGWGTQGAMATLPSFDQISQAYSGFAQHSGGGPGTRPEIPYPGIADQSGAMNLALGIMTALFVRERTGIGQKVEVSLLGTQLALQAPEILHYLHFGQEHERDFRASPTVGHYRCADGRWIGGESAPRIDEEHRTRVAHPHVIGGHGQQVHLHAQRRRRRRFLSGRDQHGHGFEARDGARQPHDVGPHGREPRCVAPDRRARRPCHPATPVARGFAGHEPSVMRRGPGRGPVQCVGAIRCW